MKPSREPRFPMADGLRGFAALLVLFYHCALVAGNARLFPSAYLAVDLFFMLSGFVIALAYEDRLRAGLRVRDFLWIRLVRLYPLALLGTIIGGGVVIAEALWTHAGSGRLSTLAGDAVKAVLFAPRLEGQGFAFPLNMPMWSLMFEIAINLAYAVALPWLTDRRLEVLAAMGGLGVLLSAILCGDLDLGSYSATLVGGLARVCWGFPVGVLIHRKWKAGWLDALQHCRPLVILSAFAIACLPDFSQPSSPLLSSCAVLLLFPLLIALAVRCEPSNSLRRLFHWMGLLSYPIYAIHSPLLSWAAMFAGTKQLQIAVWMMALCTMPAAYAALRLWDDPIRKRLQSGRRNELMPEKVMTEGWARR